jgi:hypothetical protein
MFGRREWLRKGTSIKKLCRPCDLNRLKRHRKEHPEWAAQWQPIIAANGLRIIAAANRKMWKSRNITHCKRAHELTPENSYVKGTTGTRQCRACQLDSSIKTGASVTETMILNAERALLSGINFKQITTPMDGRRSILFPYQFRNLRLTRPDAVERLARCIRNPVTINRIARGQTIVPMPVPLIQIVNQLLKNF